MSCRTAGRCAAAVLLGLAHTGCGVPEGCGFDDSGWTPTLSVALFDERGVPVCFDTDAFPVERGVFVARPGEDEVSGDSTWGQARLTEDGRSFVLLDGACNRAYVPLGRLQSPLCEEAEPLLYRVDIPGCVPAEGMWTQRDNRHPIHEGFNEYRIPVRLTCDDNVVRWPEGEPQPDY